MMSGVEQLLHCRARDLAAHPMLAGERHLSYDEIGGTTYVEALDCGLSFVLADDGIVKAVHLYAEGHQGSSGFRGRIPCGLRFNMSREEVRELLGQPDSHSDGGIETFLGAYPPWDSFRRAYFELHVEYTKGEFASGIRLITLRRPV